MSRTVNPEQVRTLADWVRRWPKAPNLGFDEESREPTVYSADGSKSRVKSFAWARKGDTMTLLTNPSRYPAAAVDVARRRYARLQDQRAQLLAAGSAQLRTAEAQLLEAWREYDAAPRETRSELRRNIIAAERVLRGSEKILNETVQQGRQFEQIVIRSVDVGIYNPRDPEIIQTKIYVPPMPLEMRGISMVAAAGSNSTEEDTS